MKIWKKTALFLLGGAGYVGLELLWRGRSHGSMFLAGGTCFLLLGSLHRAKPALPLPLRCVAGSVIITSVELLTGLLCNRGYNVWDYRTTPLNLGGQICLMYSLLWIPVSFGAFFLYDAADRLLSRRK